MDAGRINLVDDYANENLYLPKSLPDMTSTWRLLIYPAQIKAKTAGGIILAESSVESINALMTVGIVCAKGRQAYQHEKFRNLETGKIEPWCDVGDWIVFNRAAAHTSVIHEGQKFVTLADDGILYRIEHPSEVDPKYSFSKEEIDTFLQHLKANFNADGTKINAKNLT